MRGRRTGSSTTRERAGPLLRVPAKLGLQPTKQDCVDDELLSQDEVRRIAAQDAEFTVEDGKLWILQTRSVKRTPKAALRFAIDFVEEGLITPAEALQRLNGMDFDGLVDKRLVDVRHVLGRGIGAAAGVAVGCAAFDSESAERLAAGGEPVILMRPETSGLCSFGGHCNCERRPNSTRSAGGARNGKALHRRVR
jgi:hypothetical protein